jgi:hypothetical protein
MTAIFIIKVKLEKAARVGFKTAEDQRAEA